MMHLPITRRGRDFLERGLIEARFCSDAKALGTVGSVA
jgi:hypothetical protein